MQMNYENTLYSIEFVLYLFEGDLGGHEGVTSTCFSLDEVSLVGEEAPISE